MPYECKRSTLTTQCWPNDALSCIHHSGNMVQMICVQDRHVHVSLTQHEQFIDGTLLKHPYHASFTRAY